MTESGSLLLGVPFGDTFHFAFTVKLPVVRDTMNARKRRWKNAARPKARLPGCFTVRP